MKSAVNIVKIGTSIILKVFINFITNKEVHMMTFWESPYKEVYLNNVVWLPDTTLRIMINMAGVSIFEEANIKEEIKMNKFEEEMKLRREWEQIALEHFDVNHEEKLSFVETLIRKAVVLDNLIFGNDKKTSYEVYVKCNLDELESNINLMRMILNMRKG